MDLKKYQYHFFILPAVLVVLSLAAVFLWGLKPNVELAGGSLLQVHYEVERPVIADVEATIGELDLGEVMIQPSGDSDYILRQRVVTPDEKTALVQKLSSLGALEEMRYTSIGPSVGSELVRKAWWAIGLVILSTILYIAFAFRGVGGSKGNNVPSWKYGLVAILTLVHDVLIPVGLYAYLGYAYGSEVGTLFIVALLTILGISINDTIVIFDRIRENLAINENDDRQERYADVVWRSITQTLARSINTSLTVIMMLLALVFLGPESTRELAITLTVGMIAGTYSSIFLAAPMLVVLEKYQKTRPKKA
jgi:preprotein translocase subunit SecF